MLEMHAAKLYQLMRPIVGAPWDKIVLHGEVTPEAYQFDIFFRRGKGEKYINFMDVTTFNQRMPISEGLAQVCYAAQEEARRKEEEERIQLFKEMWTGFNFVLTADGDFTIDYEYGEHEPFLSKEWRGKYLV